MSTNQCKDLQGSWFLRRCVVPMLLVALVVGCSGGEDKTNGSTLVSPLTLNSPADMTNVSADNYDDNVSGLITGKTLKRWKDDWVNQRPSGITGKLVILEVTTGEASYQYIVPATTNVTAAQNVVSYQAASAEWVMTRSNGVISTPSVVLDGPSIDAQLNKYGIDPANDMIVIAQGTASSSNVMSQGRAWLALHYWGVDAKHLAALNGSNQWQFTSGAMTAVDFAAAGNAAPSLPAGTYSVKNLPVDNTALIASVSDFMAVVPSTDKSMKGTGIFLWDARTTNQYSAGFQREANDGAAAGCGTAAYCNAAPTYDWSLNNTGSFQNNGSRQGHPNGAVDLNFINLLNNCNPVPAGGGCAYKTKAELANYMDGGTDAAGNGMHHGIMGADGVYTDTLVGAGNGYQPGDTAYLWCETTFRAMITGMASAIVLGHPTRFYDGGMIEWNSLSNLPDATGNNILPADSPWRTDVKSFFRAASNRLTVATRQITNAYAPNSNAIIALDRAYKTPAASNTSKPGGGAAPANPCGG